MNIPLEILRYIIFLVMGIIFTKWYVEKKAWDGSYRISLTFNLIWKTINFFVLITINLTLEYFWFVFLLKSGEVMILTIITTISWFFLNIFLGIIIFKIIYKQKMQESIILIIIIVIIEMFLDIIINLLSFILYYTLTL